VSIESQAPALAEPDEGGAALVEELLGELDAGRTGPLAEFVRAYVKRAPPALRIEYPVEQLAAQVRGVFAFADDPAGRGGDVRVYNPSLEEDGWTAAGTVVDANVEDSPFLVDTVTAELHAHGCQAKLVLHPVMGVERDEAGHLRAVTPARGAARRESIMHFQTDRRLEGEALTALRDGLVRGLSELHLAVRDFLPMVERVERMIEAAQAAAGRYPAEEVHEATEFLSWLTDDNFIYLGYREYRVEGEGDDAVASVAPGSGLGILADDGRSAFGTPQRVADLAPPLRARITSGPLVLVSKTNSETRIHRRARMDYVGVKRVDGEGRITGELRLIGLFTSKAYGESARQIPLIRGKLEAITRWEDLIAGSHDYKAVVSLFDSFPKDELFAASAQQLRATIMALLGMQEERSVRVFVRRDPVRRIVAVIVAVPRDHVSTDLRVRLQHIFEERFGGRSIDYSLSFATDPARFHFTIAVAEGEPREVSLPELQREVADAARTWDDALADALIAAHGEHGRELAQSYCDRFPEYYKSAAPMYQAVFDVEQFERLGPGRAYVVALQNESGPAEPLTRLKLYKTGGKAPLTDLLPLLEQLGLTVVEEVPTRLAAAGDGEGRYLHDFGVLGPDGAQLDLDVLGDLVADTVSAVWDGRAGSDWLNRLVVAGPMDWRRVSILRAYREYRQLLGATFTSRYQNDCLVRHAGIARDLVRLFEMRFAPAITPDPAAEEELRARIAAELDSVTSLDDDRILRGYLGMIMATVRTNAFVDGSDHVAFKLRCADVPAMPKPVPLWEIFVFSPDMAGVHLRGGPVARGGIRWSDRLEDYRTEVLGLMKAQMVKNAVIVPVGAKGGFVLKRPPAERAALKEEERRQYITFIRGLLDVTDNIVGGSVVHPRAVRVLDGEDPYLVVAADKGTAHLSDTANEVSAEYGFWLGDAFASGGSTGYDHKALAITAKGAWESVRRHFRELGRDADSDPVTAVGVGDMSGDVFGNGMLISPHLRLVAAFDHRHVFLDPSPEAGPAHAERRRLFDLPGSSWDDYDRALISAGGGVWPRTAKSVPVSAEARAALGIEAEALTPAELIQAVLRAPVDLLWNGGIGTYVKASTETHDNVGDRANDAVRVDGRELRCAVVGEGGNLGFTQRARIEYARGGGRINTDAIDNSGGVDCSDHEVNLKILLAIAVERGELTLDDRNALLHEVAGDVVAHVLYDNYLQVQILAQETAVSPRRMEAYEDLMAELESRHVLDRALESLPSTETMAERGAAGEGLSRPELCVLLAYAKRLLREQVLESALPDDAYVGESLRDYFPGPVIRQFGHLLADHPLRREIVATIVTNDVINSMGITFVSRMTTETGAAPDEVARAFIAARDVSRAREPWEAVEQLPASVPGGVQTELMDGVDGMVEHLARWYLQHVHRIDPGEEVESGRSAFAEVVGALPGAATPAWRAAADLRAEELVEAGVPADAARFGSIVSGLVYAPDVIAVARSSGRPIPEVARVFFALGERLYLDVIEARALALPGRDRWERLAWSTVVEDLRLLRRQIAERVLAAGEGLPVDEALDAYLAARADPYQRLVRMIESLSSVPADDGSVVMVAVHQIRQVTG
jgi:glutamate dehydrogenase